MAAPLMDRYIKKKLHNPGHSPDREDLRHEGIRLLTFEKWPVDSTNVYPTILSSAGLYFTGNSDVVKCFECDVKLAKWKQGDVPLEKHKSRSPTCTVARGNSRRAVKWEGTPEAQERIQEQVEKFALLRARLSEPPPKCKQGGGDRVSRGYRYESERMQSFAGVWPSSFMSVQELARSGFYYLGELDRVQCFFCRGILRNWEPGDVVAMEHRKHFTDCPFINGRDVGNVGIESSDTGVDPTDILAARHTEFTSYEGRMKSFANWPESRTGQRAENVASAGFYYTGEADDVKCFYCDGGLKNWTATDVAWEEHARWFPRCQFLQREKGAAFISRHSSNRLVTSGPATPSNPTPAPTHPALPTGIEYRVDPREIKARLDTPMVKSVLALGYSKERVSQCIGDRLRRHGDDFQKAEALLEAVLNEKPESQGAVPAVTAVAVGYIAEDIPVPSDLSPEMKKDIDSLRKENQSMKEGKVCKVCMDKEVNVVFLPCGHLVCCQECAPRLNNCPICRNIIRGSVKIYNT